jgi:hypothetical protein
MQRMATFGVPTVCFCARGALTEIEMSDMRQTHGIMPDWLLAKRPSPNATTVYVHLTWHSTPDEAGTYECRISLKALADSIGFGIPTIRRALQELEALGAITSQATYDPGTGGRTATTYRMMPGPTVPAPRLSLDELEQQSSDR